MKRAALVAMGALGLMVTSVLFAKEGDKVDLKDIKCPVSGKAASEDHAVDYKGAKVYFCCPNCPGAFNPKEKEAHATKANHQLVATKQAEQKKCPITGKDLNKNQTVEVADVKVVFCCPNCKGKVAAAEGDEQLKLVFGDANFKKGFEVKKEKEDKDE